MHPYFKGIDWNKVVARTSKPPFESNEIQVNQEYAQNIIEVLKINVYDELEATLVNRFSSKLQAFYLKFKTKCLQLFYQLV